jgi:hypothetical protein
MVQKRETNSQNYLQNHYGTIYWTIILTPGHISLYVLTQLKHLRLFEFQYNNTLLILNCLLSH